MSRFTIQVAVDPLVVDAAKRAVPRGHMAIEDWSKLVRDKCREWARDGMIIAAAGAKPNPKLTPDLLDRRTAHG